MGVHNLANKAEFDDAIANNKVVVLDAYVLPFLYFLASIGRL